MDFYFACRVPETWIMGSCLHGIADVGSETTYLHLKAYRCVIPSLVAYKYFEETI
jgi:hypothetical protein